MICPNTRGAIFDLSDMKVDDREWRELRARVTAVVD